MAFLMLKSSGASSILRLPNRSEERRLPELVDHIDGSPPGALALGQSRNGTAQTHSNTMGLSMVVHPESTKFMAIINRETKKAIGVHHF